MLILDEKKKYILNDFRFYQDSNGYWLIKCGFCKKSLLIHRVLTGCPKGMVVDHINHNKSDNRIENLRICTVQQNNKNLPTVRASSRTSKYKGVSFCKGTNRWISQIQDNKKAKRIGRFDSEVAAAKAYNEFAKKMHGEFASLNEIPNE